MRWRAVPAAEDSSGVCPRLRRNVVRIVRDKANLVAESGAWVRRMQKSLDQMNLRVHRAVSYMDGVTGLASLRAIGEGEQDAQKLAQRRDRRCSKSE